MHVDLPPPVDTEMISFYLLGSSLCEGDFLFIQGALVLVYLYKMYQYVKQAQAPAYRYGFTTSSCKPKDIAPP